MKKKRNILLVFAGLGTFVSILWVISYNIFGDLPSVRDLPDHLNQPSIRIEDRNGRLLYESIADSSGRNNVVPLDEIPLYLQKATIATEDRRFYTNSGIDQVAIFRSVWAYIKGGGTLYGGSTITQQVARNLLLDSEERTERTIRRKLRESYLAWQISRFLSKDEVLALYLNQIYYGALAYGVEAAAQTYFGKPVSELDLAECALIAGLPQAPAIYNPFVDPQAAEERQKVVLGLMEDAGYISDAEKQLAENEPLQYAATPYPIEAPHFVMMVQSEIEKLISENEIRKHGGIVVRTTLELDWQKQAERAVVQQIEALRRNEQGISHNLNDAALVALDPATGEILAMVGSPDFFDEKISGAVNMALAPRQPGSAIKPLVYAAALDPTQVRPWTAATMLLDVRTTFTTLDGKAYIPENYDQIEHGPVLLREGLASSLNIPAVLTLQHVGIKNLSVIAKSLGITTLDDPKKFDLSLALGGGEVRLLELTSAYAAFANGGYKVESESILKITDLKGNVIYIPPEKIKQRAFDERVAWLISDILSDKDARLLGFGPNTILQLDRPAAVKTGTTSNFHDNWTIGYTPDLVVGVWAGNSNYEGMRDVSGLTGAAPIWHQFMREVLSGRPARQFPRPKGIIREEICKLSGLIPTENCSYKKFEWFIQGTQPAQKDTFYKKVMVDAATGQLADASTPKNRQESEIILDLPLQAQSWARSQGLTLLSDLQNKSLISNGTGSAVVPNPLQMIAPAPNGIYRLAQGLPAEIQRLRIEAVGEPGLSQVIIKVDGEVIAEFGQDLSEGIDSPPSQGVGSPFVAWWSLMPGSHQVWAEATRQNGVKLESQHVSFQVEKDSGD